MQSYKKKTIPPNKFNILNTFHVKYMIFARTMHT